MTWTKGRKNRNTSKNEEKKGESSHRKRAKIVEKLLKGGKMKKRKGNKWRKYRKKYEDKKGNTIKEKVQKTKKKFRENWGQL